MIPPDLPDDGPTVPARFRVYPEHEPRLPVCGVVLLIAAVGWTLLGISATVWWWR